MKYLLSIIYCLLQFGLISNYCIAQNNVSDVVSSGGGKSSGGIYTNFGVIGETIINYTSVSNNIYKTYIGFLSPEVILTNIKFIENDFIIKVFPNPTQQYLNIEFYKEPHNYFIELYNNFGQCLLKKESANKIEQIDLNGFTHGIYYLRIFNNEFFKTEKIIVN